MPLLLASCSSVPDASDAAADDAADAHRDAHTVLESAVEEPAPAYAVTGRVIDRAGAAFPTYAAQGKTVPAMWALNPFAAKSSKPIAVNVKNVFGLAAGAKLAMRAVDDAKGPLLAEIPLTVSSDATTITTDVGGLDRLT